MVKGWCQVDSHKLSGCSWPTCYAQVVVCTIATKAYVGWAIRALIPNYFMEGMFTFKLTKQKVGHWFLVELNLMYQGTGDENVDDTCGIYKLDFSPE